MVVVMEVDKVVDMVVGMFSQFFAMLLLFFWFLLLHFASKSKTWLDSTLVWRASDTLSTEIWHAATYTGMLVAKKSRELSLRQNGPFMNNIFFMLKIIYIFLVIPVTGVPKSRICLNRLLINFHFYEYDSFEAWGLVATLFCDQLGWTDGWVLPPRERFSGKRETGAGGKGDFWGFLDFCSENGFLDFCLENVFLDFCL